MSSLRLLPDTVVDGLMHRLDQSRRDEVDGITWRDFVRREDETAESLVRSVS
jgi:hypothetical protein